MKTQRKVVPDIFGETIAQEYQGILKHKSTLPPVAEPGFLLGVCRTKKFHIQTDKIYLAIRYNFIKLSNNSVYNYLV